MSCTIEKALADAKALVERLRDHDDAAESLIEQTTALSKRVEAMKQYQEEIQELNEVARHRPRSTLVMGIQQENRQIRELQQENKELRTSLEEHQSALELIMSKYREQMFRLLMASKKDDPGIIMKLKEQHSKIDMVHRNNSEGFFLDASRHILEAPQHGLERRHLEANQNANNYLLSVQSLNPGQCRKSPDHKLGKLLGIQNLLQLSILKLLLNIMLPLQWEEFKSFLKTITEYGSSRHGSVIKESD
ncbi:FGFR1 oncogene partner 2 isoform X2 [Sus scrofa]|uniref:FGFR1 oncogene partner 2 isoform X2 n=1 Tax=Sus scrofa TaxID=9823 RepID=UPI000A2B6FBD|nr:FGFR1 oncogene partner 2 isoform X2 [Sus scrofa]